MSIKLFKGILVGAVLFQSCSSEVYNNKTYLSSTDISEKKVAILPVQVEFTGKLPQDYSIEKKISMEETESTLIQNLLYSEYLYQAKRNNKKQKPIELINTDQVNSRLKSHGISIRESWAINPDSLGKIIGADLVLKAHVKKDRIMSETASFGIGVMTTVLGSILNKSGTTTGVSSGAKTYTINLQATLSDVNNNIVVSRFSHQDNASWDHSPESVIRATNKKFVRKGSIKAK
jgi:hypothetical protein